MTEMPRRGGREGMGLTGCPVPGQMIRKECYCLLDKSGVLGGDFFGSPGRKKGNHWPGMHLRHSCHRPSPTLHALTETM